MFQGFYEEVCQTTMNKVLRYCTLRTGLGVSWWHLKNVKLELLLILIVC
jgi:hypothetical protein